MAMYISNVGKRFEYKIAHYITPKDFDLKAGDYVKFRDTWGLTGNVIWRVAKVVAVYDHIFHVEYMTGPDNNTKIGMSFSKISYQLGEVKRIDR